MSNLTTRTLSGIVYVLVVIGCILFGPSSYCILFSILAALTLSEFNELVNEHQLATVNNLISTISGVYLFLAFFCYTTGATSAAIFMPYLLSLLYMMISELYLKHPQPVANWAYSFAGQLYIALPYALLNLLAFHPNRGFTSSIVLAVFVFLWLNDSGAYCFGSMLHRKIPYKLFPRISPNKSWIGSIGGGIVVLLSAIVFSIYEPLLSLPAWLGLGLTVCVFGSFGDLVESLFKRQLGIKDSGHFMPGHGGALDRFDSMLLAVPAAVIYIYSIRTLC